ncbi:MAG: hypothetical protein U9Q69_02515 [Nanoarchaeota archaeon]|nr:hypothetical protein [Nanoarchaeota archaeon]
MVSKFKKGLVGLLSSLAMMPSCMTKFECEKPGLEFKEGSVPVETHRTQENIWVKPKIEVMDSYVVVSCEAGWNGRPKGENVTYDIHTKVAAAGESVEEDGNFAMMKFYADNWDKILDIDAVYCTVIMDEVCEIDPDRTYDSPQVTCTPPTRILSLYREANPYCRQVDENDTSYCGNGYYDEDGFHCTNWHK